MPRIKEILKGLSDTTKAKILAILPLQDVVIDYLKELEENAQLFYWENVDAWGWLGDGFTQVEYIH